MSIFDVCINSTTVVLLVSFIVAYLAYDYWQKLYFKRNGIPGPMPLPLIGTLLSVMQGFTDDFVEKRKKYGHVYGINLRSNVLVISDIEMLQEMMVSKFSSFPNRGNDGVKNSPFDKAVSLARDEHWKSVRNTLTPAFTANKMKQMTTILNETCDQLLKSFESNRDKEGGIQCKDLFGAYSMDVVASIFFGLKVDSLSNPDDPFVKNAKAAFEFSFLDPKIFAAFFIPGASYIMNYFDIGITNPAVTKFFMDVISQTLEKRKNGEVERMDVLQLMANAHQLEEEDDATNDGQGSSKKVLSTDEIMANAVIFILAGYETTNTALCFTSYFLATNQDLQDRVIQELDEFVPTRDDLCYEVLGKLEYLDCFIRESLRLYPPASILDRQNERGDIKLKNWLIPDDTRIFVPIYAIHHDPDLWEEPEVFNPERFNKENRKKIRPLSWIPFGDGPRNCIGMRLALMEIKFALVRLLQAYRLETCPQTEIPPVLNKRSGFTSPVNGIKLNVVPRKKTE